MDTKADKSALTSGAQVNHYLYHLVLINDIIMFIAAQFSVEEDAVLAQRWRRIMQVCNVLLY